jgi:hypothetical protein
MIVIVHSVSWLAFALQHQLPSSWPNGQQPIETSHLAAEVIANLFLPQALKRSLNHQIFCTPEGVLHPVI